ncbi:cupin domain-containing protein [Pseudonocardia ailaonensis]|uniref:Cupin domain-containing protein n=1 Tax=Pseudonocardia ailaonensis TaxID=367279 RepID=A0ABN2NMS8_9PSEU
MDAIGPKVRAARSRLGLSLQQLAVRADVSAAAVHKVERGDMVPTVTTLLKLASALGEPVSSFVDDVTPAVPVAVHVRAGERIAAPRGWAPGALGVAAQGIAAPTDVLRAAGVAAVVEPGGESGDTGPRRSGEELVHVLEGTLSVEVAGATYEVGPGDTLHYPTDRGHSWRNAGDAAARAIWVRLDG